MDLDDNRSRSADDTQQIFELFSSDERERLGQALIAVLFVCAEPLKLPRLASALGIDDAMLSALIEGMTERQRKAESGGVPEALQLLVLGDTAQLVSSAAYAPYVKSATELARSQPLSRAALEVLAVIAYRQPVTRAYVEQVRGVDCSGSVRMLCDRELIEEKGRLELPGRPIIYGTTAEFLRCFGLGSVEELPKMESFAVTFGEQAVMDVGAEHSV